MNESVFAIIRAHMPEDPARPLLEDAGGRVLSYGDMELATARYARFIAGLGLARGERVAVLAEKSPEALFLYLACARAGLVYVPMNPAFHAAEVGNVIDDAEPGLVVCGPEREDEVAALARGAVVRTLDGAGRGSLAAEAQGLEPDFEPIHCAARDLAAILYTSGTTGRPKGAMLSHRNLASNGLALRDYWGFSKADVLLHALPIFHTHGLFVACHCVLLAGARMLWLAGFERARVLALMPRASVFMGVPTYYTRLLDGDDFGADDCRAMRLFVSGSAPLLPETFEAFRARTGHAILERYGMTETGMNTSNPLAGERRAGTVGLPLPGVSARVAGEDGELLDEDQVGVLQVRGPNVCEGYWRMPAETAAEFTADGWFKTGDLAKIDGRGYVHIMGRAKDLVISGGLNVYPKEIEGVIDEIEGVAESAVIGVPHPDFGEAVAAVVRRGPGQVGPNEDAVIARVKAALANYKVPKRVFFVDELPRNAMGKVQKSVLRQRFADAFAP